MPLTHEPDTATADWIVGSGAAPEVVALQGPAGFPAYATVRFDAGDRDPYRPDPELVALVTRLAADHTTTPRRAWFALWEGWGEIEGGDARLLGVDVQHRVLPRVFIPHRNPVTPPAFERRVLEAPRVDLGGIRAYLLFRGALDQVGAWGARPLAPGWPRDLPQASLTWPEDRAWVLASDVDPTWFTIGGSPALVEAILAHPGLDAAPATHGSPPPLDHLDPHDPENRV